MEWTATLGCSGPTDSQMIVSGLRFWFRHAEDYSILSGPYAAWTPRILFTPRLQTLNAWLILEVDEWLPDV
jgi:hypothetical protein